MWSRNPDSVSSSESRIESITHWAARLAEIRNGYRGFIDVCRLAPAEYRLTPNAEPTPYALCFAVFGLFLLSDHARLETERPLLVHAIRRHVRELRRSHAGIPQDKPYRQLLTFSLSALACLQALAEDPLADLVREQIPDDIEAALTATGALQGAPQSGNQAMFLAVFLLHAQRHLGMDTHSALERWTDLHVSRMNRFGFWGPDRGMTHLLFQNGYHQYEILEYLGIANPRETEAVAAACSLADPDGHFAPYPGGGGCYDYDAVAVLTPQGRLPLAGQARALLNHTAVSIASEQTETGGFAESRYVRPRSPANLGRMLRHVWRAAGRPALFRERLRYFLALQRARHGRIHTHWSRYSRRWDEANLWDSWFRMLTLARIQVALEPGRAEDWGFIDYPGIGFHPGLRRKGPDRA